MSEEVKKNNGAKVGAALGATAGALGTVMANPVGRWLVLNTEDELQLQVLRFTEKLFHSAEAGNVAYRVFGAIANTIIAYPAILPIVGGLLAAGVGALVGNKISKGKLKHKSLSASSTKEYTR